MYHIGGHPLAQAVLDEGPAIAQRIAAPQVGVQPVEQVHPVLKLAEGHVPERRLERSADADVALVRLPCGQLVVGDLDPAVEEVRDGRGLVGDPLRLELSDQADLRGLRRLTDRMGLLEVGLPPRDGVRARVDDRAEPTLEGLDLAGQHAGTPAPQANGFHEDLTAASWPINVGP
jgi:hypothetical protein